MRDDIRALAGCHARVSVNELFGGDDAGGRHVESGDSLDVRLAGANLGRANEAQAFDAVLFAAFLQRGEFRFFVWFGGNDEFAAVAIRHVMLRAKFVGEAIPLNAEARLQRVFRVVDAGVVDAAVARAGGHAQLGKLLDEKNVLPARGDDAGDGAADHATADDQNIRLIHFSILLVAADGVEVGLARNQARFSAVVDRVGGLLVFFVSIAPQRSSAVRAVLVERVKINMESPEFFLVVFVVVRDTNQSFKTCLFGRHALAHHFDDGVAAGNFYVFLALASGTRRADFIVHAAARADDR